MSTNHADPLPPLILWIPILLAVFVPLATLESLREYVMHHGSQRICYQILSEKYLDHNDSGAAAKGDWWGIINHSRSSCVFMSGKSQSTIEVEVECGAAAKYSWHKYLANPPKPKRLKATPVAYYQNSNGAASGVELVPRRWELAYVSITPDSTSMLSGKRFKGAKERQFLLSLLAKASSGEAQHHYCPKGQHDSTASGPALAVVFARRAKRTDARPATA
jgi:hypothetical protein